MSRTRPLLSAALLFAAALSGSPVASAYNLHQAIVVTHGAGPHPPPAQIAKVCAGPSVTVWVVEGGRRVKDCKCAPGAVGQLIENRATGAKELRCLRPAGPRP